MQVLNVCAQSACRVLQPRVEALLPKVYNIYQFGAEMEVYGAIYTLFTLFRYRTAPALHQLNITHHCFFINLWNKWSSSTHRNVVFTLALWQFMRVRYLTSATCKLAFGRLRHQLDTLILHGTWAPSFLRSSYSAFCIWAYSMVDPAQQQQQSRCTIM